jgi:simple sugar transport system substrate-binding protein
VKPIVLLALLVVLAGCGATTTVRESGVVVAGGTPSQAGPAARPAGAIRIAVVTHGQASSPFWAIVRNGVQAAARQLDVLVDYRAPDVYSVQRMSSLIDQAVAGRPDGLVVSIPEPGVAPAIRRAVRAGIPVVAINSGSDVYKRLGVLAFVGQPEERAGLEAGRRLAAAGVRRALCVNEQVGTFGLDSRCRGLAVDDESAATPRKIARAVTAGRIGGVLAMNATSGLEAVRGLRDDPGVKIGTFDLGPDVLAAVRAGRLTFAVDQQAYLQGYWPIAMLAQRARYGLFPAQGDIIATGPHFVTRAGAAKAIELSRRSIR